MPSSDDAQLIPVTSDKIERAWPHVQRFVENFLRYADGCYLSEDIKAALLARDMQLWLAVTDNRVQAVAVTQIVRFPRKAICHLLGVAGDNKRVITRFENDVREWAAANGCDQFEALARRGWLTFLPDAGWRVVGTVVRKGIADGR